MFTDLKLQCCECKSTFTSASRLLQHFAEHVQEQVKARFSNARAGRKKRRAKREAESGSESNQSQTLSASSSCSDSSGLEQTAACKLARLDLQKRLETCINVKQEPDTDTVVKHEEENEDDSELTCTKGSEEYNSPLRFCTVTMEETEEKPKTVSENPTSSPKKVASRKQLVPKKIERKLEGLRKLAPKPESVVIFKELPLQSPSKKKYACHLCTKVFGWSTDLKRHILTHTGERPFRCETCQATFTRNFLLQKHQTKVHPCKPKEPIVVKTEILEIMNIAVTNEDVKEDPLKEEAPDMNKYNDDDEDEHKLVITEEVDEISPNLLSSECSSGAAWHLMPAKPDRRCSRLKQSDIFNVTPIKVLTM